jgi:uncharacterized membrane protein
VPVWTIRLNKATTSGLDLSNKKPHARIVNPHAGLLSACLLIVFSFYKELFTFFSLALRYYRALLQSEVTRYAATGTGFLLHKLL